MDVSVPRCFFLTYLLELEVLTHKPSMKSFIFSALLFSSTYCYGQTIKQQQSTRFNKDSILVAPAYWQLLATYDGRKIVTQTELADRTYKFTADGQCRITDNLTHKWTDVVRGKWNFDTQNNSLMLHLADQDKTYTMIRFNKTEMLLEDSEHTQYYFKAKATFGQTQEEGKRLLLLGL